MGLIPSRRLLIGLAAAIPAVAIAAVGGPVGIGIMAGLIFAIVLALLGTEFALRPGPEAVTLTRQLPRRLEVGEPSQVSLTLRNQASRPWMVRIADGCPPSLQPARPLLEVLVPAQGEVSLSYDITPCTRGAFPFAESLLRLRRPQGFAEHSLSLACPGEAKVLPGLRDLARHRLRARRDLLHLGGARRTRVLGRDGDFDRLRDFVTGDDLRHVDWKATARLVRPITRVWQAEKAQNLIILVDGTRLMATRAGELSKLDHAISAALTLAWAGLAAGDRVGVGVFDGGMRTWVPPDAGLPRFRRILESLYDQQPVSQFPRYRQAARHLLSLLGKRSLIVWITDLLDADQGEELLGALAVLRRRHLSVVVALDDPEVRAMAAAEPSTREELYTRVGASEVLDARAALLRRLRAQRAVLVDVPVGRLQPELVDRYLDIKMRGLV